MATSGRGMPVSAPYHAHTLTLIAPLPVLAFYAGAHGCIGSRFATIESVRILALLVRQYEMLVPADLDKEEIGPEERAPSGVLPGSPSPTSWKVRLSAAEAEEGLAWREQSQPPRVVGYSCHNK